MSPGRVFRPAEREIVRDFVLSMASADPRVVAGAEVGSRALGGGDRWSDLDLTFGVQDDADLLGVLDDWAGRLDAEGGATKLFDVTAGPTVYRVFLVPGCLQVDLSVTPASRFGPAGPAFDLLFGRAADRRHPPDPAAEELFGHAVHHALRARFSIERGRAWQAEYWLSALRDQALGLACLHWGAPAGHGRGFDDLPLDVRDAFAPALARSLEPGELRRALVVAIECLVREADDVRGMAERVAADLALLMAPWPD